jgi:hypothetical protein
VSECDWPDAYVQCSKCEETRIKETCVRCADCERYYCQECSDGTCDCQCGNPCSPYAPCGKCCDYWSRMRDEGLWVDGKGWTNLGRSIL